MSNGNECSHNCESCSSNCSERKAIQVEKLHDMSSVKKVIAVLSGKGGVGKSLVTGLLSVLSQRAGSRTAILDADITGPSIPKAFNIHQKAEGTESALYPVLTKTGIQIMSINVLLPNETDPVVWRGPVISGAVRQFWTDVIWNDVDIMFIDMPPGTGDVPLTVFQSIPIDGVIVVTSPQELVSMVVEKAVNMAKMMHIPVIGLVENMSYFECPNCREKHALFGESHIEEVARRFGIETTARIPINPKLAAACDKGMIELFEGDWLDGMLKKIEALPTK
ncbi:MAG TPA: Mrp/NBP35 family ATP-binding protein [Oscillospiraceae bacterium]|nr:Mrp/NBP35 family ATP-binding protein [Oscillospiraceae bacterium]HPS34224.1 Mrp/NBP35 family ATP-binding protein [Oscillospiraceae bacterium]